MTLRHDSLGLGPAPAGSTERQDAIERATATSYNIEVKVNTSVPADN